MGRHLIMVMTIGHGSEARNPNQPASSHMVNGHDHYEVPAHAQHEALAHGHGHPAPVLAHAQNARLTHGHGHPAPVMPAHGQVNHAATTHDHDHYAPVMSPHGQVNHAATTHDHYAPVMSAHGQVNHPLATHAQHSATTHGHDQYTETIPAHGHVNPAPVYASTHGHDHYAPVMPARGQVNHAPSNVHALHTATTHGRDQYSAAFPAHGHVNRPQEPNHALLGSAQVQDHVQSPAHHHSSNKGYTPMLYSNGHEQDDYARAIPSHALSNGHSGLEGGHSTSYIPGMAQHDRERISIDHDHHSEALNNVGLQRHHPEVLHNHHNNFAALDASAHGHPSAGNAHGRHEEELYAHDQDMYEDSLYAHDQGLNVHDLGLHGHDQSLNVHGLELHGHDQGMYAHDHGYNARDHGFNDHGLYAHVDDYINANDVLVSSHLPLENPHGPIDAPHALHEFSPHPSKRDPRNTAIEFTLTVE